MKANFSDSKHQIFKIGFFATFTSACDKYRIHEGAAMWVLPHYISETLAKALNSCICAKDQSMPPAASVRNADNQSQKLSRS